MKNNDESCRKAKSFQRARTVGTAVGVFIGCAILAVALSQFFVSKSFELSNTKGHVFTIDLSGQAAGIQMVPGSEQSLSPVITNTGTEKMYVFVRFDVETDDNGDPIYSFTPSSTEWTQVPIDPNTQLIYMYGIDENSPTAVLPDQTAQLSGVLKLEAENQDFPYLEDDDFKVTITGCAIGTDCDAESAQNIYSEYLSLGGE